MSQARRRFSQLQCIVVRGGDGQPKPEDGLDESELKTLHAARHHCFKRLTGRTPPMLTAIQVKNNNNKLLPSRRYQSNQSDYNPTHVV